MCPFCLTAAALIAGSATGAGGVAALAAGIIIKRSKRKILPPDKAEEMSYGNNSDRVEDAQNRIAR